MSAPQKITERGSETVSTTVLCVGGSTNWTVNDDTAGDRAFRVTNCTGGDVYFAVVPEGTSLTGAVSGTNCDLVLASGESDEVRVPAGNYLAVVSASSSTVRFLKYLYVNHP